MSSSSVGSRIEGLLVRLRSENNLRERDPLREMDDANGAAIRIQPPQGLVLNPPVIPNRRNQLLLNIPIHHRNIETNNTIEEKLKEIMKINGILTIAGVKYETKTSDMEHLGELGNGTCGEVVKMRHKPSGAIIAVKQMRRSGDSEETKRIIMDIDVVLKSHDCPYIVQCLGCFITEADVWICMELMATCFDKLLKRLRVSMPENVLRKVTYATVKALSYLKEKHDVIHRDVKPSNILVDEKGNVKLCDFGISGRLVDSMARTRSAGCAAYMAPERIEPPNPAKPDYDIRADVWSLGITLVELATGVFPYQDCGTDFEVLAKVLDEDPPSLPKDKEFSDEFRAFVTCCLIKNYEDRPKYVKLLEQPFLRNYDGSRINVDDWFQRALRQADLLGVNSPGRRYTPAPPNIAATRRHTSLQQRNTSELQQLSNGGSVGPPPNTFIHKTPIERLPSNLLPPDRRGTHFSRHYTFLNNQDCLNTHPHQRDQNHFANQRSPDKHHHHQSPDISGRYSPFLRRYGESPPHDNVDHTQESSPYASRRHPDGFRQSPICSPLPIRKQYHNPSVIEQVASGNNTSPILLQRFLHQQKQFQAAAQCEADSSTRDEHGGKKRFASHIKLQLSDRCSGRPSRHQSPEPPPRLSRGSSTESSLVSNQSPLAARRNFLEANSASPNLSRRYISPSPPQPPPRRLSESSSVPGSPQHFRARIHYTPQPQRRIFHNNDVS